MPRLPRNLHLVATWRSPARFTKTRNTTRLKCCACHEKSRWTCPKCCACHENATHLKTLQKYCACHTKRLSTRYKIHLNVTKCHACHAKRSNETFDTYKKHPSCRTYHRHGHIAIARTVANGCERLRTVADGCGRLRTVADGCGRLRPWTQRRANTPSTPRPPEWNGNPCYAFGKKPLNPMKILFFPSLFWFLDHPTPRKTPASWSPLKAVTWRALSSKNARRQRKEIHGSFYGW